MMTQIGEPTQRSMSSSGSSCEAIALVNVTLYIHETDAVSMLFVREFMRVEAEESGGGIGRTRRIRIVCLNSAGLGELHYVHWELVAR